MFVIRVFDSDANFLFSIPIKAVTRTDPAEVYQKMINEIYASIGSDGIEEDIRQFKISIAEMISAVNEAMAIGIENMSNALTHRVYRSVMVCFFQHASVEFEQRNNDGFDGQIIVPKTPSDLVHVSWSGRIGLDGAAVVAPESDNIEWHGDLEPYSSEKKVPT